ncbi:MAG: hypothetical protein ACK5JF_03780 [Oscillospiraceae bacterium]
MGKTKITPDKVPEIIRLYEQYGIDIAAKMLAISRSAIYKIVNAGKPAKPKPAPKPVVIPPPPPRYITKLVTVCEGCNMATYAGGGKYTCPMISCDKVRKIAVRREVRG